MSVGFRRGMGAREWSERSDVARRHKSRTREAGLGRALGDLLACVREASDDHQEPFRLLPGARKDSLRYLSGNPDSAIFSRTLSALSRSLAATPRRPIAAAAVDAPARTAWSIRLR